PCPVCGLVFEREPGYFLGAMYVSYPLGIVVLGAFYYLAAWMFPQWDSKMMVLAVLVPYVPLMPLVFRYSRVIWIHYDRWRSPTAKSGTPSARLAARSASVSKRSAPRMTVSRKLTSRPMRLRTPVTQRRMRVPGDTTQPSLIRHSSKCAPLTREAGRKRMRV